MPRDYANAPRHKHKAALPGWVWMLGGLFIGLFVALLVYLDHSGGSQTANIGDAVSKLFQQKSEQMRQAIKASEPPAAEKTEDSNPRPRFDFYTILPELEVAIPEEELIATDRPPTAAAKPGSRIEYVLQAGSFRNLAQADRLKARLALQGIVASIQTVKIKDGETWHRVRVGPIHDIATLNQTRKRLRNIGVPSIVVKNKT